MLSPRLVQQGHCSVSAPNATRCPSPSTESASRDAGKHMVAQIRCPAGGFCSAGVFTQCPEGLYSLTRGSNLADCLPCPRGGVCAGGTNITAAAGWFGGGSEAAKCGSIGHQGEDDFYVPS